jgi:hypothetical protein
VRMLDSVSSRNRVGATFSTKLERDFYVGKVVAIKAGTRIYGEVKAATQARRAVGQSTLDIRLNELHLGGKPLPISTGGFAVAAERGVRKAARGAAAGAIIGGIADGSDGAGKGAALGGALGAMRRGSTITISSGTLLEFSLAKSVKLTVSK